MRILNPAALRSPLTETDRADFAAALAGPLAAVEAPTFAEVRAALPSARRARWTDGMIHQAALDAGMKVEP